MVKAKRQCIKCGKIDSKYWRVKNTICESCYQEPRKTRNRQINKAYYLANKEKVVKQTSLYEKNRLRVDPEYKLRKRIRSRVWQAIKRYQNNSEFDSEMIFSQCGCSISELISYLESKFTEGMSWDNYGEWHIDHIIPLCSGSLNDSVFLQKVLHFSNMHPLWAKDNLVKSGQDKKMKHTNNGDHK